MTQCWCVAEDIYNFLDGGHHSELSMNCCLNWTSVCKMQFILDRNSIVDNLYLSCKSSTIFSALCCKIRRRVQCRTARPNKHPVSLSSSVGNAARRRAACRPRPGFLPRTVSFVRVLLCIFPCVPAWREEYLRAAAIDDLSFRTDTCSVRHFLADSPSAYVQGTPRGTGGLNCGSRTLNDRIERFFDLVCEICPYYLQVNVVLRSIEADGLQEERNSKVLHRSLTGSDEIGVVGGSSSSEEEENLDLSTSSGAPPSETAAAPPPHSAEGVLPATAPPPDHAPPFSRRTTLSIPLSKLVHRHETWDIVPSAQPCRFEDEMALLATEIFEFLAKKQNLTAELVAPLHLASEQDILHPLNRMYYKNTDPMQWSDRQLRDRLILRKHGLRFCEATFLASWWIVAQFYVVRVSAGFLAQEWVFLDGVTDEGFGYLEPWPLEHRMLPVLMNFYAYTLFGCCNPDRCREHATKFILKSSVHDKCGLRFTDSGLVQQCRARWDAKKQKQIAGRDHDVLVEEDLVACPVGEGTTTASMLNDAGGRGGPQNGGGHVSSVLDSDDRPPDHFELNKYSRRVSRNQCAYESGLWTEPMADRFKCMTQVVGLKLNIRPAARMLDWGSGCGHMLTWFNKFFGVEGLGLDVEESAVNFANRFGVGRYCQYDGNLGLDWIPPQHFDHVISCGALIHARAPCNQTLELLSKLKVGGTAWLGCMPSYTTVSSSEQAPKPRPEPWLIAGVPGVASDSRTYADSALTNEEWIRCFTEGPEFLSKIKAGSSASKPPDRLAIGPSFDAYAVQDHLLYYADPRLYTEMHLDFAEPEWFVMTDRHVSLFVTRRT